MQLGLSSYACAWAIGVPGYEPNPASRTPMGAAGLVRHAAALGLQLVQIADNLPLELASITELDSIREAARSRGVSIELGTRGIDPPHIRRMLELCEFFGSSLLRVVVDTAARRPDPDEVVATVRSLLPNFSGAGVRLAIENHDRFPVKILADILGRVDSAQVGICLDTVNSLGSCEGPGEVIAQLSPFTINVHVKDFTIHRASHMMGFTVTGTPAGQGLLDIPALLEKLRALGRDPNALLELWPPPESRLEDTIRKEEQWREESVRYLRTLIPAL